MLGALVLGLAFSIYAIDRAPDTGSPPGAATDPAIVVQTPSPGAHVVRQTSVGVELQPGYDGRITVDGVEIPEDQMDGAAPAGSPAYDVRYGVRPNNKQHVSFTPGEDKVVKRYRSGEVHVSVRFWPIAQGEAASKTVSWAYFVN